MTRAKIDLLTEELAGLQLAAGYLQYSRAKKPDCTRIRNRENARNLWRCRRHVTWCSGNRQRAGLPRQGGNL